MESVRLADFQLLTTERLLLRAFEESDAPVLYAYRNDPEVSRYQGWETPYSLERALTAIRRKLEHPPGSPGHYYQVAVELRTTGQQVGDVAFKVADAETPDDARLAEIGFTFAREHQGNGYATEAACRLLAYLFEEMAVHRVCAHCDVLNGASSRVLERLGMRREAHVVEAVWFKGYWSSEYVYAILRREWEAAHSLGSMRSAAKLEA